MAYFKCSLSLLKDTFEYYALKTNVNTSGKAITIVIGRYWIYYYSISDR